MVAQLCLAPCAAYLGDSAVETVVGSLRFPQPRMDGTDHCYTHGGLKAGHPKCLSKVELGLHIGPLCSSSVNKDDGCADVEPCQGHHSDWDSKIFNYLKYEAGLGSVPRLQPLDGTR